MANAYCAGTVGSSPQDLSTVGRIAKQIRKGKYDDNNPDMEYESPDFVRKHTKSGTEVINRGDCTRLKGLIKYCLEKKWHGTALRLFGELCHDLLFYIRSRGPVELIVGQATFQMEKRGKSTMEAFCDFLNAMTLPKYLPNVQEMIQLCCSTPQIAEKVHLRTILVLFADLPSLFLPWSPVKISRLLGSGGQRTIFEIRTRAGEYFALRPDTRNKELERMFVCLEALDASHLFHIFEALEFSDGNSRCHLFMPVMMELDQFFTSERLRADIKSALALAHHTALQLHAMSEQGLVHRDVKPANILVYTDTSSPRHKNVDPKGRPFFFLTDFGWSCEKGADSMGGSVGGTKQYRDPYMYVIPPHPKHDIWCMGLSFLFLINRVTENNSRATMVRKIKVWQENILNEKSEGAEFSVNDFTRWMFQWDRMAVGPPIEDIRRFRVGSNAFTGDFRDLERGCLDLRWEKRWNAGKVLDWTERMAKKYNMQDVTTNSSFKQSANAKLAAETKRSNPDQQMLIHNGGGGSSGGGNAGSGSGK